MATKASMKGKGSGRRAKPQSSVDAFATHSRHGLAMRCGDCRYFAHGWCSVRAQGRSSLDFACNYGFSATTSKRKQAEMERRKISSPHREAWPKKPKSRSQ